MQQSFGDFTFATSVVAIANDFNSFGKNEYANWLLHKVNREVLDKVFKIIRMI